MNGQGSTVRPTTTPTILASNMATLTKALIERVTEHVGRFNTDVLTGWEAGLLGKQRIGGRLYQRFPPEHLQGQRLLDWIAGYEGGLRYKAWRHRMTHFVGQGPNGEIRVVRKGWVARGPVVTQLERAGARGDVLVFYFEDGKLIRQVNCGI